MKPITRSKIRIKAGKIAYTTLRYLKWAFSGHKYAKRATNSKLLEYEIFSHSTPLIRKLSGLDMRLQKNKIGNLAISVKKIDGVILKPGEVLSFWKLVGKPTKRKGYKSGLVLNSGGLAEGIGGGLCQLTNLIYWMVLHTPLDVLERYRHSYDVFPDSKRTQPFGSGATCVYNYRDLLIQNNTDCEFQLKVALDDNSLSGEWRSDSKAIVSYEVYEKKHWINLEYWGGYMRHNLIFRKVFDSEGKVLSDEYVTENHALMMYHPFLNDKAYEDKNKSA